LIGLIAIFIILQFIPLTIPENKDEISNDIILVEKAPDNIKVILNKACYDCHSNQVNYPWYSKIAPISWMIIHHINEGREKVNFSEWNQLSKRKKIKFLNEIAEVVEKKEMPLSSYTLIHRDAILTDTEISAISDWTTKLTDEMLGGN
jgi:hypothetical protein